MFETLKKLFQQNTTNRPAQKQSDGKGPAGGGHPSSAPGKPGGKEKMPPDEKLVRLVEGNIAYLRKQGMGEEGKDGHTILFDVPGTNHRALLRVAKERWSGKEHWQFSVGVHEKGYDRLHSYLLCGGYGQEGKDKIAAYLARPELPMELVNSVQELSHHVWLDD